MALVGYGAYRVGSQKKTPSGAREASPLGPPPAPGLGEISATCGPTLLGARGDVFSAALDIRSTTRPWDREALERVAEGLRSLAGTAGPGYLVRIGAPPVATAREPAGGATGSGAQERNPERGVVDWRASLEPGTSTPRLDDLVVALREAGAEPLVDISLFARSPEEAAALVAFLNGTDDSDPEVARRRAAGRDEPPRVAAFELGSRPPSSGLASSPQSLREYAANLQDVTSAMRARSPIPIQIFAPLADWDSPPGSLRYLGEVVAAAAPYVDGFTVSFALGPSDSPLEAAGKLERTVTELRRLVAERAPAGRQSLAVVVSPWDMSGFASSPASWRVGLLAGAASAAAARSGAWAATYPGIPSGGGAPGPAGYLYWPTGEATAPSPAFEVTRALAQGITRELLETEVTYSAAPALEGKSPTETAVLERVAAALMAQCARGEGARHLVLLNLSEDPVVVNVKVGFKVGDTMRKTVLVAPLDSPAPERSEAVFLARSAYSDSLPPHSVTVWTFPQEGVSGA